MPRRALRCLVELNIQAITCPGVWLPRRDDLYVTVTLFGEKRRTALVGPLFPALFHERFRFDKIFYTAYNPGQVVDALEDETIVIELVQMHNLIDPGRTLAYYEANVKDFLYPYPTYSVTYGVQEREVLMDRSLSFPGISPRLEFSTVTSIKETSVAVLSYADDILDVPLSTRVTTRRSRSRSRSRLGSSTGSYGRPTISSIYRSRSVSPLGRKLSSLDLEDYCDEEAKPPFVVRKVGKDLIGRVPGTGSSKKKRKPRSRSAGRLSARSLSSLTNDYYDYKGAYDKAKEALREAELNGEYDVDEEVSALTSSYRSPSPVLYRSSLRDRYLPSASSTALLTSRVERALARNRSPIRIDPLYIPRYRRYGSYDSLDRLALDLDLARERRYYYPYLL